MPARPARTAAFLFVVAAAAIAGSMVWPSTAASGGKALVAPASTAPAASMASPPAPPATAAATGLDPGLVTALEKATAAARAAGHRLSVTSGFRTAAEQEALLAREIAERGREEALRWVFPPERSMHVRGLAVDVGDGPAADWLDDHGARWGLCRTLAWEWWHFEWRHAWETSSSCPRPVNDPKDAPR